METFEPGIRCPWTGHIFSSNDRGMKCLHCERVITLAAWQEKHCCFCKNTNLLEAVATLSTPTKIYRATPQKIPAKLGSRPNLINSSSRVSQYSRDLSSRTAPTIHATRNILRALLFSGFFLVCANFFWGISNKPSITPLPLYYTESFKNPDLKYWTLSKTAKIKDGAIYQTNPYLNSYLVSAFQRKSFNDLDFSADVIKVSGPNNVTFGIFARATFKNSAWSAYYLQIQGDGHFTMGKLQNGKWLDLSGGKPFRKSNHIRTGNRAKNNLKLVIRNDKVIGFINNQEVYSFVDRTIRSGVIGVDVDNTGNHHQLTVYFDNIEIRAN